MKTKIFLATALFVCLNIIVDAQNTWTQKANLPASGRVHAAGFSIGTKGYIGIGYGGAFLKDFWQWDQPTNVWTQKADFGGTVRDGSFGFSIGTKGYIGAGYDGISPLLQDCWALQEAGLLVFP